MNEMPSEASLSVLVEKLEGHKVKMEVTVPPAEVGRAYERAYRRLVNRVNIPGFRRGRAPRPVLERHVGAEAFREEALELALSDAYPQALDIKDLEPIASPDIEVVKFEPGEAFVFRATVEVRPEVKLGKYTGLELDVPPRPVTEAEIEAQLSAIRERRAELLPTEPDTPLTDGLFAVVDYEGTVDGRAFPGGKVEGALVEIGRGQLEPALETAIRGAKAGEERQAKVSFPPDLPNPDLAGKEALFQIRVREVKTKKLPELTDELAKELTGLDLAELRERIRRSLEDRAAAEAREELARQVVERVVAEAEVDLPETLVERRMRRMTEDTEERLRRQNLTLDQYLTIVGLDRQQWEKDLRARAEHAVKKDLVLGEISRREKIEATEAEIEFEMVRLAAAYGEKPEKVRSLFANSPERLDSLRAGIISQKTVQYLVKANSAAKAAEPEAAEPEAADSEAGEAEAAPPEAAAPGIQRVGEGRGER